MKILLTSKTVELSNRLKEGVIRKFSKLNKFASVHIETISVVIDRVKRRSKTSSDAKVEVQVTANGRRYGFSTVGQTLQGSLAKVYERVEKVLRRSHSAKTSKKNRKL